jgi:hypothetical protein
MRHRSRSAPYSLPGVQMWLGWSRRPWWGKFQEAPSTERSSKQDDRRKCKTGARGYNNSAGRQGQYRLAVCMTSEDISQAWTAFVAQKFSPRSLLGMNAGLLSTIASVSTNSRPTLHASHDTIKPSTIAATGQKRHCGYAQAHHVRNLPKRTPHRVVGTY